MAEVNHSTLTDPKLHEPKGCSTASSGMVYVSNGAGSGQWKYIPTGWGYYKDDDSAQNFTSSASKMTLDGAGATTEEDFLPNAIRGTDSLWDTTNDFLTPIALGDIYNIRLDLPVTAVASAPTKILVTLDIGGSGSITNALLTHTVDVPASQPYTVSMNFTVSVNSAFLANGLQVFVASDTGNFDVTKPAILISRTYGGDI
jgi:hypothetical protein